MSWLARRPSMATDDASASAFAAEFAGVVDRSFPIDDDAVGRMRAQVLGAFIEAVPSPSARRQGRLVRRGLALGLATSLGVLAFGAVAVEARPGGPFYPVRLAIESATLASADAPEGWHARLDRLQRRIDEAVAAGNAGDPGAITAALTEYRSELASMTAGLVDPARRSALVSALQPDLVVALDLERTYPSDIATLVVADIRTILGPTEPGSDPSVTDQPATGGPAVDETTPDHPGDDTTTGNPHADGTTGDPHTDGATGNPHTDGATGNPHTDGATGNPHAKPNAGGDKKPHAKPKASKPPANSHAGGNGKSSSPGTDAPGRSKTTD